ncbi:tubby C-terminal domain-like protein [Aquibacillus rhizosphaerae]|uniref:Tubby C-terminal domain-containing protein n=1 Tax=Aquibacillus rhizosphaerae TaxID=3051431 RepID=A0ABT7L0R9_9BACI|nr:hypothetical protein [Aquibacillus sp. LR5S19]MDL4839433.1 hypothetical protein [Aquibacillus sp. LR5S19]
MYYFKYSPGFQFKDSTKPIELYQGSKKIGKIKRIYKNWFTQLLDTSILKNWFTAYEILDNNDDLKFKSKESSSFFGKQQYDVTYVDADQEIHSMILKDVRKFHFSPIVKFHYKNLQYTVTRKERLGWTEFSIEDQLIAQWKRMNISIPDEIEVQLVNEDYFDDIFLIVGVFHTFFYDWR